MQILPPELLQTKSAKSKDKYDRLEFLPNKLESGTSETFRLLGTYESGHIRAPWRCPVEVPDDNGELRFGGYRYSNEEEGFPNAARLVNWSSPEREKIDGQFTKPKRALCALGYSYERDRIEVMIIEQRKLKDDFAEFLADEDYCFDEDGLAEFVIKISKQGAGIDTSYSSLPKPRKVEDEVRKAFLQIKESAKMDLLLQNQNPLEAVEAMPATMAF